ncbi:hypothetical protein V8B97DRAFT_2026122 [Scleroderma yunnanense]
MLDCFFADEPSVIVKETCSVLLKDHQQTTYFQTACTSEGCEKAFQSAFVLQLLANVHIHVCFRSVDVPVLQLLMETNRVRGAIALCVAVLECAFKLVRSNITLKGTGKDKGSLSQKSSSKPSGTDNTFSKQNWGGETCAYFEVVANHDDHTLLDIVKSAHALLPEDKDDSSLDGVIEDQECTAEEIDACKLMCKSIITIILPY